MPTKTIKTQAQTLSGQIADVNQKLQMWLLKKDFNVEYDAVDLIKWAQGAYTYEITRSVQVPRADTSSPYFEVGLRQHQVR